MTDNLLSKKFHFHQFRHCVTFTILTFTILFMEVLCYQLMTGVEVWDWYIEQKQARGIMTWPRKIVRRDIQHLTWETQARTQFIARVFPTNTIIWYYHSIIQSQYIRGNIDHNKIIFAINYLLLLEKRKAGWFLLSREMQERVSLVDVDYTTVLQCYAGRPPTNPPHTSLPSTWHSFLAFTVGDSSG